MYIYTFSVAFKIRYLMYIYGGYFVPYRQPSGEEDQQCKHLTKRVQCQTICMNNRKALREKTCLPCLQLCIIQISNSLATETI